MAEPLMLTLNGACSRYAIGKTPLLALLASRRIPAVKLRGRTLILRPMADAYFEDQAQRAEPEQLSLFDE